MTVPKPPTLIAPETALPLAAPMLMASADTCDRSFNAR